MQELIVFVIVAVAAAYTAWQMMPPSLRRGVAAPALMLLSSRRDRLERLLVASDEGACGSCKGCSGASRQHSAQTARAVRLYGRVQKVQRA